MLTTYKPRVNLLSLPNFEDEMEEFGMIFFLFGKITIPNVVMLLLEEFFYVLPTDLLKELSPLQDIHQIDLVLRANLLN